MDDELLKANTFDVECVDAVEASDEFLDAFGHILGINHPVLARDIAERVIERFGRHVQLHRVPRKALMQIAGIGPVRAERIQAIYRFADILYRSRTARHANSSVDIQRVRVHVPEGQRALLVQSHGPDGHFRIIARGGELDCLAGLTANLSRLPSATGHPWSVILVQDLDADHGRAVDVLHDVVGVFEALALSVIRVFVLTGDTLSCLNGPHHLCL
ncbi:MAG: hypothetical protein VX589_10685 [Myxococcota bacterium]|nr:hypothetical protein [Myxococcota bacterium]